MARVKKLAPSRSQQSRPRPVDTSRANEDRSRGESREFPRGSQSRRWHPTKRLGEARPAPPARQKTKPRRTFPDDEQENVNHNQNLDQHSNRDFTDYHHHQRPPHHHRHNQPGIDRQSNYAQDDQYKPRDDQYERRDDQYEHRDDQYENDQYEQPDDEYDHPDDQYEHPDDRYENPDDQYGQPEVYHEQPRPPPYPLQTSSQPAVPSTHHAYPTNLVPNYPPSHYHPYSQAPAQPSSAPLQQGHEYEGAKYARFRTTKLQIALPFKVIKFRRPHSLQPSHQTTPLIRINPTSLIIHRLKVIIHLKPIIHYQSRSL
ncbi:hypothetical protein H4Q26_000970 [Puccinia striiformis f. sp. tritici PST-130]|nr:hypothetical protein H4Q26_000970 [Puccinia striiformis f. sp. tritici PST-130]